MRRLSIVTLILSMLIVTVSTAQETGPIDDLINPAWSDLEWTIEERKTAKMFAIVDWPDTPGGTACVAGDREWWDDLVGSWYDAITGEGLWVDREDYRICAWGHCDDVYTKGGSKVDYLRNRMFADVDVVDWGRDHLNIDNADAVMLGWHGNQILESGGEYTYAGSMSFSNPSGEDCQARGTEMELGDGDLEFLHFSSCHSLGWKLWPTWWQAFDGLHVLTGFHGVMYVAGEQVDNYRNFANEAFHSSIAEAWLDNLYLPEFRGGDDDQCPVAYAVGNDRADVLTRLSTERYNLVQRDPRSTEYHGAMWIGGCNPSGESPLPYQFLMPPFDPRNNDSSSATDGSQSPWLNPQEVRAMVQLVFPQYDRKLLQVQNGEDWVESLSVEGLLRAVDDNPAPGQRKLMDEEIVRMHKDEGRIFYVNRRFAWDLDIDETHELMSDSSAAGRVWAALEALGFPVEELGDPHVATQIIGADHVNAAPNQGNPLNHEMYRIVTYPRSIPTGGGKVPVHGSEIRGVVNSKIQRLKLNAPTLTVKRNMRLRNRGDVLNAAVAKIMKRDPQVGMVIRPQLVYTRGNNPENPIYYPAIAFLVESGPTPFEIVVRVAK